MSTPEQTNPTAGADAVRLLNSLGPNELAKVAETATELEKTLAKQAEHLTQITARTRNYERTMDIYEKIHNEAEDIGNAER